MGWFDEKSHAHLANEELGTIADKNLVTQTRCHEIIFYDTLEWSRVAELMMIKFRESGHPVFRATSPLSRGTLKSKGGGQLSVHFCADGDTIETVFRTIVSVHQLSIYGAANANPAVLEQGDLLWWDNLTHCLCQQVR